MTNSVCLPSADLGFGLGVPSPKRFLNFSLKPESLLVGLAIVGRNAPEDPSVPRKQAQRFQKQLRTCHSSSAAAGNPRSLVGTFYPRALGENSTAPRQSWVEINLGNARPPAPDSVHGVKEGNWG